MATTDSPFTLVAAPAPTTKALFKSKTVVVNLLIAIGLAIPAVGQWVQSHGQESLLALAAINLVLRKVTHEKLSLFGSDD